MSAVFFNKVGELPIPFSYELYIFTYTNLFPLVISWLIKITVEHNFYNNIDEKIKYMKCIFVVYEAKLHC